MSGQKVATNHPLADVNRPGRQSALDPLAGTLDTPVRTKDAARVRDDDGAEVQTDEALRVVDLSKTYRSGFLRRRIPAIDGISFTVPTGSVFGLLGRNGAGKTTTINCILDLVRVDRGHAEILGCDHRDCRSRRRLGYLPERPYFFDHLTGIELLQFYAQLLEIPARKRKRRLETVLAQTGMTAHGNRRLKKYSKGMLQRIGLAQALIGDPDLLILDEPMSGLDPIGRRQVRDLLTEMKDRGKTIILSSHIVPDIEMLADAVAVLAQGRLVANQSLAGLQEPPAYRVTLGRPAAARSEWRWPAWIDLGSVAEAQGSSPEAAVRHYAAPDVEDLRGLLARCRREDIRIGRIESIGSGLEDLFLRVTDAVDHVHKEAPCTPR